MAEQLGQAVLTISADTRQLDAGLQRARQQAEQAGTGISNALGNAAQGTASTVRSIQELQNLLQGLQQQQVRLDIDSSDFKAVQQDIIRVKDELQAIERRRLLIDVDANSVTAVVTRLQSQLEQLRRQQISIDIDSSEFPIVSKQIASLEGELLALERRKIVASVDDRSIAALQAKLQGLQQRQITLDVNSSDFREVETEIQVLQQQLAAIERRRVLINVDSNSITAITTKLQADLERLQQQRLRVNVDSREFAVLGGEIDRLQGELEAIQRRAIQVNVDDRSLVAVQAKLQDLQQRQAKVSVDSSEFRALQLDIDAAQQQLQEFSRRRLLINVDTNSVTAITTELQAQLNQLQQRQLKVNVDSQEFQSLGVEIGAITSQLEALQRRVITVSVDAGSLEGIQGRLQDLQQRQAKVNVDSSEFEDLQRQIVATQAELAKIDSRRIRIDVDANSITAQTTRLKAELDALRQRQVKIDVDSGEFATVSRQIRLLESELDALDRRRITASVDDRSIVALQARLQGLRRDFESTEIGTRQFRQLNREIQATERELARFSGAQRGGLGAIGGILGGLGLGIGAGAAVTGFFRGAIDQAIQLETVTRKLSNTLGAQGAGAALNFTKGLSNELGLNFKTLADSFARFTAAATAANVPLQTQRDLFAAVSKAGQSLGLSNDEINGSFLALQQIASKGVVSFEELRQQLGERLPIALSATARGLGISQKELIKLVESGRLTATEFFPALTKGLNELTAGAGGLPTAAQNFGRFRNAWEQLQASFGKNLLPGVTKSVQVLTDAIEGLSVVNQAKSLGFDRGLFSGGLLSGVSTKGAQAVATLRQVQQQFNLNDQQARNIFSQAVQASGGQFGINGLQFTDEQYGRLLDELTKKAEAFRQKNRDIVTEKKARDAAEAASLERENKRTAETQKQLDVELRRNQAAVQFRNLQEQLASVRLQPGLDDAQRTALQNRLSLNEKIRAVQVDQLALQRELAKPTGTGDGKPGAAGVPTQNQKTIDDLQKRISEGQTQVAITRLQNQQADAAALRTQQERVRGQELERANAAAKLGITQQQTQLERQALAAGVEVSRTAQLRLQQEEAIAAAQRQQQAAQQALNAELSKPKAQQDRVVLDDLFSRVARANEGVRQAYADAGLALVQNARSAADALKSAQQSFNSTARGGFQFLTPAEQQRQLIDARRSVQQGVDSGLIRTGIDISTPERLFQLAGLSEQLVPAQRALQLAIERNAEAAQALADKNWDVYVSVPGQPTFVPISNT